MKSILILFLFSASSTFSQIALDFPDNLLIDPYDYNITRLGFKEVIQYRIWENAKTDSRGGKPIVFVIQHVINYDSLKRISNYKFDFSALYYWSNSFIPTTSIQQSKPIKDSSRYYFFSYKDKPYTFVFQDYQFIYEDKKLARIELHEAEEKRFSTGLTSPAYYPPRTEKTSTELVYGEKDRLLEKRIIRANGETEVWRYFYSIFPQDYDDIYLLNRVELDYAGSKHTYHIEYRK